MDFLSLQEPVETPSASLHRSTALLLSLGLHVLAVLLFVVAPARLPESVLALIRPWLAPLASRAPAASRAAPPVETVQPPPAKREDIPLKFAYVKVPEDAEARRNPEARLRSDRDRRARQEVPTPPDARLFSADPHSEGTTIDRVRPDPRLPEGRDSPEPPASPPTVRAGAGGGAGAEEGGAAGGPSSVAREDGTLRPPEGPGEQARAGEDGDGEGKPGPGPAGEGGQGAESLEQALSDVRSGEYKFQFSNPAYLKGANYGTLSFDTQGFPWGDYARRIYVIIRNNWFERIPLAAREGLRGWVCWRFEIQRDGAVTSLALQRGSGVPPFDRAASDALRASGPLPALPAGFPKDREGVTFCFYYNMYPGEAE